MTYPFQSNQRFLASSANDLPGRIGARAQRETDSTATAGTEIGVLRLDGYPITNGYIYEICIGPLLLASSVANDTVLVPIRVSTSGNATTSSTRIQGIVDTVLNAASAIQRTKMASVIYPATVTGMLSVLMSIQRIGGTGNVYIEASNVSPIQMWIRNGGIDPGDTGTEL